MKQFIYEPYKKKKLYHHEFATPAQMAQVALDILILADEDKKKEYSNYPVEEVGK